MDAADEALGVRFLLKTGQPVGSVLTTEYRKEKIFYASAKMNWAKAHFIPANFDKSNFTRPYGGALQMADLLDCGG